MKVCKKETFLYWFVHSIVWIGIALPTVFFLLRISHPKHTPNPRTIIFDNTTNKNETSGMAEFQSCTYSTQQNCAHGSKNYSENASFNIDEEMKGLLDAVLITKHACKQRFEDVLCIKKYVSCTQYKNGTSVDVMKLRVQLVNKTNTFCAICSKHFHIRGNISFERKKWLRDLSCTTELLESEQNVRSKAEKNVSSCLYPLVEDETGTCRIPCNWSLMSPKLRDTYYAIMVVNFWVALITTVITLATLASFPKMREFPHIVRFYILICSAMYGEQEVNNSPRTFPPENLFRRKDRPQPLKQSREKIEPNSLLHQSVKKDRTFATANLLPLRIGLAKVYCGRERFWREEGHSTIPTIIEGAMSHYFFLALCFWSLCYVINAYSVIIKQAREIFEKKCKHHIIQFSICSILPALFVAINMAAKMPGYKSLFLDRMTSVFTSPLLEYLTFTLPVQITIGVLVSLLWSIIRFVRKVRQSNATFQSVRPDDDIRGFINAERQFIKLAVLFIVTVAIILSSEVVITYRNEEYLHKVDEYFECLKTSGKHCSRPAVQIFFLSSVKICGPGFYCLLNFFLLFFNKDTRTVWRKWFHSGYNILLCKWFGKDGKSSSRGVTTDGTRPRSCTLDTNASMSSLHKLSMHSTAPLASKTDTLQTVIRLDTLHPNENQNTSTARSCSPKEDSPLQVNQNTS